jgi:hypothetical protein
MVEGEAMNSDEEPDPTVSAYVSRAVWAARFARLYLICEQCCLAKPDATEREDPMLAEVYDEHDVSVWCDQCWDTRKAEV